MKRFTSALSFAAVCLAVALPKSNLYAADDAFLDLDLTEVLNLEVTSVSKKPQTVSQAAAAVTVITAEDIRNSGASSLADVLRLAPGIQVAQISANAWAVSARGFNGRFSNKLLVLMDGRSVYSPTYSGVYWDVQDTVLEDIERIEIIRGPGASIWGANAVNGVINIMTKSAAATQGNLFSAKTGTQENFDLSARYGGKLGDSGYWRMYAKAFSRDGTWVKNTNAAQTNRDGDDDWKQQRIGFRADMTPSARDALTVQGDMYQGRSAETSTRYTLSAPYVQWQPTEQKLAGGNFLVRWQREISPTDSFTWQSYADFTRRDWPLHMNERRATLDTDFQYRSRTFSGHDIVAGLAWRGSRDKLDTALNGYSTDTLGYVDFNAMRRTNRQLSAFIQDDITLVDKRWILTVGAKVESGGYAKTVETQPNARLLWTPNESTSTWLSVAKAARTSSRQEQGAVVNGVPSVWAPTDNSNPIKTLNTTLQGYGLSGYPLIVQTQGETGSESLVAYEGGIRQRLGAGLSADLSLFYNDYKNLRMFRPGSLVCPQALQAFAASYCGAYSSKNYVVLPVTAYNYGKATSFGGELSVDWRVSAQLRLNASWSNLHMRVKLPQANDDATDRAGSTPENQYQLRAVWTPRRDIDLAAQLRYVGKLKKPVDGAVTPSYVRYVHIPAYTELDARIAWRPQKDFELALIGRNLLHRRHGEFAAELADLPLMQIERSAAVQMTWRY